MTLKNQVDQKKSKTWSLQQTYIKYLKSLKKKNDLATGFFKMFSGLREKSLNPVCFF